MKDKITDIKDDNAMFIPVEIEEKPIPLEIEIILVNQKSIESKE